jgi:soluble lytic murein transglycosylase-like protein
MRPILVLAILLFGLKAAFPEVKFGAIVDFRLRDLQFRDLQFQEAKVEDAKDAKFQTVKDQDRVPSADENPLDGDTAGLLGESEINESIAVAAPIESFDTAAAIKKSNRVLASLTPPEVEAAEVAHDQGEATSEPPPPQPATTDPAAEASVTDSVDDLCNALMTSARDNDLPVPFFANLIWQESRLQRDSVSKAGALGIAQFMPDVAAEVGLDDPFDPHQAIPASARLLKVLREHFGNLGYVAAAYNAGAGRVGLWLDRRHPLPRETRTYVLRVTGRTAESWRRSPLHDSKLTFARSLPCRTLPAFAELEQAQQRDAQQNGDAKDADLRREKIATRIAHLVARRVVARGHTRAAMKVAMLVAAKPAQAQAAALPAVTGGGSVALPVAAPTPGPAAVRPAGVGARHVIARSFHVRRPVPHERGRLAQL